MVAYSFKKMFVPAIKAGLGLPFDAEVNHRINAKRQTIRAIGKRRHARQGETMQLYCGMRTRQCFKIGEARCLYVQTISIDVTKKALVLPSFVIDAEAFARADGFRNGASMHAFWLDEHGLGRFDGLLIRWEPLQ
jgi:hypothetical protein